MSSQSCRRITALALAMALALLPAAAHARPQAAGPASFAADLLDALAGVWNGLARAWGAEGMTIDPHGTPGPSGSDDETGMTIDPHGNNAEEDGDAGMTIDPHG